MKKTALMGAAVALCLPLAAEPLVKSGDKIAFLGDSITQFGNHNEGGYVNLVMDGLAQVGVRAEKIPAGVSGNKSNQMLARLQRDVLDKKPTWMTFNCGVNDINHRDGVDLAHYRTNVTEILDRCAAAGVRVILTTPTLCTEGNWRTAGANRKEEDYCAFLRETAAARKLPLADLNADERELLDSPDCPAVGLTFDGLHVNGYGNVMMAKGILRAMGLTEEQLAKVEATWRLKVRAQQPFGMHWTNWKDSDKCITLDMADLVARRAAAKGIKPQAYLMAKLNDRAPDLDGRRWRYETETPVLKGAPADGLHGRVAPLERIDERNAVGDESARTWSATAWRNERVNGQLVVWTKAPAEQVRVRFGDLRGAGGTIPASALSARFVRYTTASMLHPNEGGPRTQMTGDILDDAVSVSLPTNGFRPVWLTAKVPAAAKAGRYAGTAEVVAAGGRKLAFAIDLVVQDETLPEPKDWKFFLDLWQHPWAVARYHGVKPFSKEHYALMRPLWEELANAGQKAITTTITDLPWNHQNYDPYHSMVRHVRKPDGTFARDFALWDEYVAFCESCGLGPQVHCYTMATWGHVVYWEDEATGDTVKAVLKPGTPEHKAFWGPFLTEFRDHVKAQGRLGRVYIALDERSREELYATAELIRTCGAGLKLEMAGNKKPSEFAGITIDNYCQYVQHITPEYLKEVRETRPSERFTSTFYVCCGPARPNTFTDSPLAESTWCGLYAAANGLDGFLRWAYVNWARDPLADTTFGHWRPGDTFLVYPGCRASSRWEMLRDGIEACEKVRILRERGALTPRLRAALAKIDWQAAHRKSDGEVAADVAEVLAAIAEASR